MAMVFQDPMTSLNPVMKIGKQITESLLQHLDITKDYANETGVALLASVGIPEPERRMSQYPHELSGGMRQRVMIAIAIACGPKLLFADEPTTALDVTVQAQILDLLRSLQARTGMAVIFVTHDLGVVADLCSRVLVMYAGQVVEEATVEELFARPRHPYTEGLLAAIPQADTAGERLASIPGVVPSAIAMPTGCRFHPRCPYAIPACETAPVELTTVSDGHRARCIRVDELALEGAQ
jgi:peptide/nickel transport system ATP-binding protein